MIPTPAVAIACLVVLACRASAPTAPAQRGASFAPAQEHEPASPTIDVEHYALEIALDPVAQTIDGTCRIRLWPAVDRLSQVALDLEELHVAAVSDDAGRPLTFRHADGRLAIDLAQPLARGDFVELSIRYGGKPRQGLWFTSVRDGAATQVFTQGECEDSRYWFPCSDTPADRATSELLVSMPEHWRAVAAGERIERIERDGRAIERWHTTFPHPVYLTTLVAGDLVLEESTWEGVPLWFLADAAHADALEPTFDATGDVLSFFSKLTGVRYPYPKYSQACVAGFPFGGMENISATTLTDTTLTDERGRKDGRAIGLIAHEAAHQWFGDLLTCADWSHIWLNEGFATYMTALYTEHSRGADDFRVELRDAQDSYVKRDVGANRRPTVHAVYRDPFDLFFTGHVYQGAAVRLHLLRFVLGDAAFFRGVRRYVGEYAGRSVVSADLKRAMEAASGRDLDDFFATWIERPGFPEFEVAWRYDEKRKLVALSVNQVQDPSDGTPAVFRTPVDVEIRDANGTRVHRVSLDSRRQLFRLPTASAPEWVRFDPRGDIPKQVDDTKSTSEWLAIAARCDDVNGRRDAIGVLGAILQKGSDTEKPLVQEVLVARLASDEHRAVRAAAARALALRTSAAARAALETAAASDTEASVRTAALTSLRVFGPDAALAAFGEAQFRAGFSWQTMAAAAGLVRAAAPERAFDYLRTQLAIESPHAVLRALLTAEIAETGDARVLAILRETATDDSAGEAARVAAVSALGLLGRGDALVRRDLIALLATPHWRLRRETIAALGRMNDPAAEAALWKAYAGSVFSLERRAIEESLTEAVRAE